MIILGIETSCDETSAAIVEDGVKILSNVVASSQELHIKTGGIIPEIAAREQIKCIIPVIQEALRMGCGWVMGYGSRMSYGDKGINFSPSPFTQPNSQLITHNSPVIPPIDAIAVTIGPGLIGSLLVGVETAKTLAYLWHKPIIPVNHLLAHVYANWLSPTTSPQPDPQLITHNSPQFPLIALIVSGGHTELILMRNHAAPAYATRKRCGRGDYQWLGGTRDDAAGEAFDKIARLLNLGYPGGPAIAAAADSVILRHQPKNPNNFSKPDGILRSTQDDKIHIKLPRPMIDNNDFDFSFSGLKTAVLRETKRLPITHNPKLITALAFEVQEAITDVLVEKTIRAAREKNVKNILLCGGVAANSCLREKFALKIENYKLKIKSFVPPPSLCTDNAAAIASCAFFNYHPISWQKIQTNPSLGL